MIWLWILLGVLALIALILFGATVYLYRFAMVREKKPYTDPWITPPAETPPPPNETASQAYIRERSRAIPALYARGGRLYQIQSHDGLTLAAHFIRPEGEMRGIYLMVHGYRSSAFHDFSGAVQNMLRDGFGCFAIDHRAHGGSEGDTICFGVKERYDVVRWAEFIEGEFPGMPVIFDGVSMGAATVMAAAGLELPSNVRGIIADCGYTSMQGIFERVIRTWFHLPAFPLVPLAELYCRVKNGFGFSDVHSADCLAHAKIPVLLAHGQADSFVPHTMAEEIFAAVRDTIDIEFVSVEGAEHGMSYLVDYDSYHAAICRLYTKIFGETQP